MNKSNIFKIELGPPENISVVALDDFELEVEWTATVKQSESSFVVEWFPIPDTTVVGLSWRILKGSAKSFIITGVSSGVYIYIERGYILNNFIYSVCLFVFTIKLLLLFIILCVL